MQCSEGVSSLDLFAEIEAGVIVPVASLPEKEGSYQVCTNFEFNNLCVSCSDSIL